MYASQRWNNVPGTSSCWYHQWILEKWELMGFEPLLGLGLQAVGYLVEQSLCGMLSIDGELHQTLTR